MGVSSADTSGLSKGLRELPKLSILKFDLDRCDARQASAKCSGQSLFRGWALQVAAAGWLKRYARYTALGIGVGYILSG